MNQSSQALYREATNLIQQGRAADAVVRMRKALETNPDDEVAASILGSALLRDDKTPEALQVFKTSADRHPNSYAAQGDLGFAWHKAGNTDEAIKAFSAAVALNPAFYQGWCFLSLLQAQTGELASARQSHARAGNCDPFDSSFQEIQAAMSGSRYAEAEKIARSILSRQPGHPKAAYALAHLATRVGAHEEAAQILRYSLEHFPADMHVRVALVNACEELGRYDAAIAEARTATKIEPESFAIWQILGRVHGHCGNYAESLAAYDRALACPDLGEKDASNLALIRGHALKILGRQEESVQAYRQSTQSVHGAGAGWWGLADMKTFRFSEDDLDRMEATAQDSTAAPAQRAQAAFALGKAHEDAGNYDQAFDWYARGNRMRPDVKFDPADFDRAISRLVRTFTPTLFEKAPREQDGHPTPIFVVGLPRSGSTLVEQILSSHSQVEGTMELVNLPNILRRITIDGGRKKLEYPESLAAFSPEELAAYGQAYLDSTAVYRRDKSYFIDKMPPNFDKVGLLQMILPRALIIDARRHPMDCGFSCFKQHFAGGHQFSYDLEHIGAYYNSYLRIMDHWDTALPGKVACIQYEEMVRDTSATVERLLAHCGLPFEETCLRFFENTRPVRTASSEQVRQPIYKNSVAHWKHFESQLEPLAKALGGATLGRFRHLEST